MATAQASVQSRPRACLLSQQFNVCTMGESAESWVDKAEMEVLSGHFSSLRGF